MGALITWDQAKRELGLSGDDQMDLIMAKAETASAMVLNRIAAYVTREAPVWTEATDPAADPVFAQVQAAVLAQTCALYRFRGDDEGRDSRDDFNAKFDLDPMVVRIVAQIEDPTCA